MEKVLNQIQRDIDEICKKWGLNSYLFAFSSDGKFHMMGKSNKAFDDHVALVCLNRALKSHDMVEHI